MNDSSSNRRNLTTDVFDNIHNNDDFNASVNRLDVKEEEYYFRLNVTFNWFFLIFFVIIVIGTLMNVLFIITLIRNRRNGVLNLVLQISMADCVTSFVAITEVWSLKEKTWNLPLELCPIFSGTEILTNTSIIYLIISFNFHVISITNLYLYEMQKSAKNPLTSCSEDESNECLVRRSDCSTTLTTNRSITIDYRKRKEDVSIILPSLLLWFTSLSLSIPDYTLSSTIRTNNDVTICAILDLYYGKLLQIILLVFRVVIPLPLLTLSLLIMLWKLYQSKYSQRILENILTNKSYNVQQLIIFNVALTSCYMLTSFQRQYFYVSHTINQKFSNDTVESFKLPPLHNITYTEDVNFILSMLHYSSIVTRCLLYVFLLPKFRTMIKNKLYCNCKK